MPKYFVELSIPDTDKTVGFYSYGDTLESITPESPFILSGDNSNPSGDLNQDGSQDILDIVILVNLILDQ